MDYTPGEVPILVSGTMSVARDKPRVNWSTAYLTCCALVFVAIATYVVLQQRAPVYDEPVHLARAHALVESASFSEWLINNSTSSPGPVYALMHYALSGGTGALPVPWLRIPNLLLLLGIFMLVAFHLRDLGRRHAFAAAAAVAAVPMTWVLSGLALTEIPAMAGLTLAMFAAYRLAAQDRELQVQPPAALALALGVAVAVCGRQTYLPAVAPLVLLAASSKRNASIAVAAVAVGLLPACAIFWTWKGLVPPPLAAETHMERGLVPLHGALAFGYAGVGAILIAPRFYFQGKKPTALIAAGALISAVVFGGNFVPFGSANTTLGSGLVTSLLKFVGSRAIVSIGGAFAVALALDVLRRRAERPTLAHALGVALVCGVCVALPYNFSSRYVGMALPFLVALLSGHMVFSPWAIARLFVGVGAGVVALRGYFLS